MSSSWVAEAESVLGTTLHQRGDEASGRDCPECGRGVDRLVVFSEGRWWCRKCGARGWWGQRPTPAVAEQRRMQKRAEQINRLRIMQRTDWTAYNAAARIDLWQQHGILAPQIAEFGLGYCCAHPWLGVPTLTIPVWRGGVLVDIKHRIIDPTPEMGKYRSHLPGLPPSWFNLDAVRGRSEVFVVEGEKKAIVCSRFGIEACAYPGTALLPGLQALLPFLGSPKRVTVVPDPDNFDEARKKLVLVTGVEVWMVQLMEKIDDLLLLRSQEVFDSIRFAERVAGGGSPKRASDNSRRP